MDQGRSMPAGSDEMRAGFEKFKDMTPEEREQAFEKMKAEGKIPQGGPRQEGERKRGGPPDRGEE